MRCRGRTELRRQGGRGKPTWPCDFAGRQPSRSADLAALEWAIDLARRQGNATPLQPEHLLHIRPRQIVLQQATGGQSALLDPAMRLGRRFCRAKIMGGQAGPRQGGPRLEERLDRFQGLGLVVFDQPQVLAPRLHNLGGQVALGQQGVAAHDFAA